jgi:hypothetical protein
MEKRKAFTRFSSLMADEVALKDLVGGGRDKSSIPPGCSEFFDFSGDSLGSWARESDSRFG